MNSIEKVWKMFLKECLTEGEWVTKDDGDEILEIMDNHCFIPNVVEDVVLPNQPFNLNIFLRMIGNGAFNIQDYVMMDTALQSYVLQVDDPSQIYLEDNEEGKSFVYTYPERLFNIHQVRRNGSVGYFNQVDTIVDRLRGHSGSNRGVATLYQCGLDKDEQHIPCLNWIGCYIRDDELSLHVLFRSNDLYSAFPSNMLFLMYIGLKITDELKEVYPSLHFKGIYYNSASLHIYRGDYEQARKVFK